MSENEVSGVDGTAGAAVGAATIVLDVAYDGAPFAGFARQTGLETVQGRLEEALRTVLRRDLEIVGAGRTDAGVHALGQVVSLPATAGEADTLIGGGGAAFARSLSALAGPGISVHAARVARPGFSARFDASSREYRYRLVGGGASPVLVSRFAWWVRGDLDLESMRDAAASLVGEHDFRSFCVAESAAGKRTVRNVTAVELLETSDLGEECVQVRVVGNAFLHSMVRVIVGTLVEVGLGRKDAGWVADALAVRDRSAAGQTAPACGLTLWSVTYPDEVWL